MRKKGQHLRVWCVCLCSWLEAFIKMSASSVSLTKLWLGNRALTEITQAQAYTFVVWIHRRRRAGDWRG